MNARRTTSRRGVTLLELLTAIVIMSVIAAIIMPLITSATESYASARSVRSLTESLAYASDQIQRVARQAPPGASGEGLGVSTGTGSRVVFTDGTGVEYDGADLTILVPGADPALICRDVDSFAVGYVGLDGSSDAAMDPTTAHRLVFTIEKGGMRVSTVVFPRVWIGQGG